MFLGTYDIDEYVNIPAVTHRFSSGAAYAPSAITYSIYEEGNAIGLDEDVDMTPASPFDAVVGLYYARRQLTTAAGFERNKTYVVVVKATVDSVAAIEAHVFQVRQLPNFTGTGTSANLKVDVETVKTQTITCGAGVTVLASVGTAATSTAQTGDTYALANGVNGFANIKSDTAAILADTGTDGVVVAAGSKTGYALADATSDAVIADAVWNAVTATYGGAGSYGALVETDLDATISSRASQTSLDTLDDYVDTEVTAIKNKTDNLPAAPAATGDIPSAATIAAQVLSTAVPGAFGAGTLGKVVGDNVNATISSRLASASITLAGGAVTVGTNSDKTGYAIGVGGIDATAFAAGAIDAAAIAANAIAADEFAQAAADKVWSTAARTLTANQVQVKKNTQLANFPFFMVDSADHVTPKTGLAVTAQRSIDGAAFGACANAVAEVGNGWYKITLAAADLNGNTIALKFTGAAADQTNILLVTNV